MNFFDYIKNDAFFKPLTLKHKRIYYDCVQILIDKTKELPVLYESDAKDRIGALMDEPYYDVIKYMQEHNVKLEQEIVSYYLGKG